ncbi:unnamed protein product, partial [Rotaria sp. Silwood2]
TDTKSQISIINELTENVTDLNVDLQNHILIKQRSEMSINNLEHNCQLLDTERSTIEMLRSEKVQVCSQLSTIQRRMLQEKQQIMDYLRRIEDDLIEKERL